MTVPSRFHRLAQTLGMAPARVRPADPPDAAHLALGLYEALLERRATGKSASLDALQGLGIALAEQNMAGSIDLAPVAEIIAISIDLPVDDRQSRFVIRYKGQFVLSPAVGRALRRALSGDHARPTADNLDALIGFAASEMSAGHTGNALAIVRWIVAFDAAPPLRRQLAAWVEAQTPRAADPAAGEMLRRLTLSQCADDSLRLARLWRHGAPRALYGRAVAPN